MKILNYILSLFFVKIVQRKVIQNLKLETQYLTSTYIWYSLEGFKIPFTQQWSIKLTPTKLQINAPNYL